MSVSVLTLVSAINDAAMLMNALTPLVQQAMNDGRTEVADEEVAAARLRLGNSIDALDAAIAREEQGSLI